MSLTTRVRETTLGETRAYELLRVSERTRRGSRAAL
jgi:hypothetical protein